MSNAPVLSFSDVHKAYRAGIRGCMAAARVLEGVTLRVYPGEIVVLEGRPGSGTSTVILLAAGLLRPDAGLIARPVATGAIQRVHPVGGTAMRAAIADVLREPPALLLVERVERPAAPRLAPLVKTLARAAAWRGSGVLLAMHPGDPLLPELTDARVLRLAAGRLDQPHPPIARRIAEQR